MTLLDKLEKKFGSWALPNVTIYLIAGQTLLFVLFMSGKLDRGLTYFSADRLLAGDYWRLLTFALEPPSQSLIFAFFAWYLFYLMGSALEQHWGTFRYNVYLLLGYLLTIAVSFLAPAYPASNAFIGGSVFLAFAFLYPDFSLLIFFVLPVKIKWLALLTWLGYGYLLLVGDWHSRLLILASVGNFLLFFAKDLRRQAGSGRRRQAWQAGQAAARREEIRTHRCTTCGITEQSHPDMDFRYCPQCDGQYGYCRDHIFSHAHVTPAGNKTTAGGAP